jgi:hypothetical protein
LLTLLLVLLLVLLLELLLELLLLLLPPPPLMLRVEDEKDTAPARALRGSGVPTIEVCPAPCPAPPRATRATRARLSSAQTKQKCGAQRWSPVAAMAAWRAEVRAQASSWCKSRSSLRRTCFMPRRTRKE